jgi:hypothetical protein
VTTSDEFGGDLKVHIEHGDQSVTFESPGWEEEDEFGGFFSSVTKPFRKVAKSAIKVTGKVAGGSARFSLNAARAAGHGAHTLVKVTNSATGTITKAARGIPVVGKPLASVIGLHAAPMKFAESVASGERVDKAAYASLKRAAHSVMELAPYAQLVAASVPGIGTGVAAGIAAGAALASGRPINEAALAAARAAIPGGPLATAAFDVAVAAGKGGSAKDIAGAAALGALPPEQQRGLRTAMEVASAAANGKPLSDTALIAATGALDPQTRAIAGGWIGKPGASTKLYDALIIGLPPAVQRAAVSGIAVGFARERQKDLESGLAQPKTRDVLERLGKEAIAKSEVLTRAQQQAPDARAFAVGTGLMTCNAVSKNAVAQLRDSLPKGRERASFDAALGVHIGATTSPPFKGKVDARSKVGYYSVAGTLGASKEQKTAVVKILARKDPVAMRGAAIAIKDVRVKRTWWRKLVEWMRKRAA